MEFYTAPQTKPKWPGRLPRSINNHHWAVQGSSGYWKLGRENWPWSTADGHRLFYLTAKLLHRMIEHKQTHNMRVCGYQISSWQTLSYRVFISLPAPEFPFPCPFRWLLQGDRQQEHCHVWEAAMAVITQWFEAPLQPCTARMLKNAPPGAASLLSAAANKVLSFWWVLFWSFYKSWWHAWRKANISEVSVFPHNSYISAEEKLKLLSLSPFQLCLCSLAACEAAWCHHRVSDKNGCITNIFLWQLNFNRVCNFTELTMARESLMGATLGSVCWIYQ